jgi:prepilin-type processing-associated H-X9-DG protein
VTLTIPGSYGLEFEDKNDWDFDDLRILVEPYPDGRIVVTPVSKSAGFTFDLVDTAGNVLSANFKPGSSPVTIESAVSSYGINNLANRLWQDDSLKILLVEYHGILANVAGSNAPDTISWQNKCAPRHLKSMNVLYFGGHVDWRKSSAIDPRIASLHDEFWLPFNMKN